MPLNLPLDLQVQQQDIDRRRQMAAALQQQAMQGAQGQMVSGHYVSPGLGALAPIAQAFLSQKMNAQAGQQATKLSGDYNSQLAAGLQKYFDTREGRPGQTMSTEQADALMNNDQAPQLQEPVTPNPRRAAIEAMTSGLAPLQQVGQADVQSMGKSALTPKDLLSLSGFDAKSRIAAAQQQNPALLAPEQKEHVVNNQIYAGTPDAGYKPIADARETFKAPTTIGGDLYQQEDRMGGKLLKLDNAAKTNVSVNASPMIKGQKAGMEKWAELAGKTVSDMAGQARGSAKMLGTLNQLEDLDKKGVFSGPSSGPAEFFSSLGQSLGIPVDKAKLGNSQTFSSAAQEAVQGIIAGMGGNRSVTEKEAIQITKMAPSLSQTPQGRAQLTAYLRNVAQKQIDDAKKSQVEYSKALQAETPELFTFGLSGAELPNTTPMPATPGASAQSGAKPTVSNW